VNPWIAPGAAALLLAASQLHLARSPRPAANGQSEFRYDAFTVKAVAATPWLLLLAWAFGLSLSPPDDPMRAAPQDFRWALLFGGGALACLFAHAWVRSCQVRVEADAVTLRTLMGERRAPLASICQVRIRRRRRSLRRDLLLLDQSGKTLLSLPTEVEEAARMMRLICHQAGLPEPPGRIW
jgi:hypothetical protein